ncbi:MAG: hypothetical protein Q9170_001801 [Blastenia crenularia]
MLSAHSSRNSILKPSSIPARDSPKPPTLSREERNRQIALQHAHLIQYRKDVESRNFESTDRLIDLPSVTTASPSEPSTMDVEAVKDALRTFQPSDYDALVEERNIEHRCGYVLCPRKNKSRGTSGKYRIITGIKASDFKIVDPKEVGKWCSDECGRMALYLRIQLSEEPAWTREWQAAEPVELYREQRSPRVREANRHNDCVPFPHASDHPGQSTTNHDVGHRMKELAIERGDKGKTEGLSAKIAIRLKEKDHKEQEPPQPPCMASMNASNGGSIEGYVPMGKHSMNLMNSQDEDLEDIITMI